MFTALQKVEGFGDDVPGKADQGNVNFKAVHPAAGFGRRAKTGPSALSVDP